MATREARRTERDDDEDTRDEWTDTDEGDERGQSDNGRSPGRQLVPTSARRPPARNRAVSGQVFNARHAIQVGLLRLARSWSEAGSIYQAIHAYTEVLVRYPQTGVADAAVEELLMLADKLAQQGRYHAALNIFNKLEQLC